MELFLNFDKNFISEKVIKFLESNTSDDGIKNSLKRICQGKKLQYMEANVVVDMLLKALTIEDGKEDVPISNKKSNEELLDETFNAIAATQGSQSEKDSDPAQGTSSDDIVTHDTKLEKKVSAPYAGNK